MDVERQIPGTFTSGTRRQSFEIRRVSNALLRAPYLTDIASENTRPGSGNLSALTRVLIIIKEATHKAAKMRRGIEARTGVTILISTYSRPH